MTITLISMDGAADYLTGTPSQIVALTLIILLILKELSLSAGERGKRWEQALTFGIIPLTAVFCASVTARTLTAI